MSGTDVSVSHGRQNGALLLLTEEMLPYSESHVDQY